MKGKWFHVLNIIVLIIISVVGVLGWFGNAMSQVTYPSINFAIGMTFVWWGIFYWIQYSKKDTAWRTVWFLISFGALFYWMAGGGASLYNLFLG
ncbi:hypothetical protein N781_02415 [Pontibacillus halophilus JSM 076056 = DSM 19796]|uniref:Uncharacterized protein n=1 Tax=Pontibacillus halophilus JSM 076056 = DSM 19796 TaxID=1385510 RepID=A0A0A5GJA1_9BACI|nr:hypothetical protein [Pontibacillus halophilus]KGX92054.1 hypothetical protein N781_02415 [Pontibacillus halophilus JSM 076056 = DSM 19796]